MLSWSTRYLFWLNWLTRSSLGKNRISSDECSPRVQSHHTISDSSSCMQLYVACDWLRTAEPSYAWPSRVIQQSAEHSTRDEAQTVICSMPDKNEWLLPTKTMMWWIIYVISFISNVMLFRFNSHTFIVKLHKSVTCWMCMCMHGMNWMKSE